MRSAPGVRRHAERSLISSSSSSRASSSSPCRQHGEVAVGIVRAQVARSAVRPGHARRGGEPRTSDSLPSRRPSHYRVYRHRHPVRHGLDAQVFRPPVELGRPRSAPHQFTPRTTPYLSRHYSGSEQRRHRESAAVARAARGHRNSSKSPSRARAAELMPPPDSRPRSTRLRHGHALPRAVPAAREAIRISTAGSWTPRRAPRSSRTTNRSRPGCCRPRSTPRALVCQETCPRNRSRARQRPPVPSGSPAHEQRPYRWAIIDEAVSDAAAQSAAQTTASLLEQVDTPDSKVRSAFQRGPTTDGGRPHLLPSQLHLPTRGIQIAHSTPTVKCTPYSAARNPPRARTIPQPAPHHPGPARSTTPTPHPTLPLPSTAKPPPPLSPPPDRSPPHHAAGGGHSDTDWPRSVTVMR